MARRIQRANPIPDRPTPPAAARARGWILGRRGVGEPPAVLR